MTEPEITWDMMRQTHHGIMGAAISTWWNGISLPAIESELHADRVIIAGGVGEKGGFKSDFLLLSLAGGVIADLDPVCGYPHVAATLDLIAVVAAVDTPKLRLTARVPGDLGNLIHITLTNPAAINIPLAVIARGQEITVTLATNGAGTITTTPAQLKTALEANATVMELVSVTTITASAGTMKAAAIDYLEGGDGRTAYVLEKRTTNRAIVSIICGEPRSK